MFTKVINQRVLSIIVLTLMFMIFWILPFAFRVDFSYFWILFVAIFTVAFIIAFIFVSFVYDSKKRIEKNLIYITDEIIHELNIPLTTITANTKMLSKSLTSSKDSIKLSRIEHASNRLKRLYETLVYNITKDIMPITKEIFSLQSVVQESIEPFVAQERNEIVVDFDSDVSLFADKIGFEQMIENIISNAMKYSSKASKIVIQKRGNALQIIDNGIGMDEKEIINIYDRYYQGDVESDGRGIGLAIVKAYCDDMGVKIVITSKKNVGTTLSLDFTKIILQD